MTTSTSNELEIALTRDDLSKFNTVVWLEQAVTARTNTEGRVGAVVFDTSHKSAEDITAWLRSHASRSVSTGGGIRLSQDVEYWLPEIQVQFDSVELQDAAAESDQTRVLYAKGFPITPGVHKGARFTAEMIRKMSPMFPGLNLVERHTFNKPGDVKGKVLSSEIVDGQVVVLVRIDDPASIAKVESGEFHSFSTHAFIETEAEEGSESIRLVTDVLELIELTLTGRPADPNAVILFSMPAVLRIPLSDDPSNIGDTMQQEIQLGRRLAGVMNGAIDRMVSDDMSRGDIVGRLGSAAGISSNTVNEILNGDINCPPLNRLAGFARVLSGVSAAQLRNAAEADGCTYESSANEDTAVVAEEGDDCGCVDSTQLENKTGETKMTMVASNKENTHTELQLLHAKLEAAEQKANQAVESLIAAEQRANEAEKNGIALETANRIAGAKLEADKFVKEDKLNAEQQETFWKLHATLEKDEDRKMLEQLVAAGSKTDPLGGASAEIGLVSEKNHLLTKLSDDELLFYNKMISAHKAGGNI